MDGGVFQDSDHMIAMVRAASVQTDMVCLAELYINLTYKTSRYFSSIPNNLTTGTETFPI